MLHFCFDNNLQLLNFTPNNEKSSQWNHFDGSFEDNIAALAEYVIESMYYILPNTSLFWG